MTDPANPTADDIRRWANDATALEPVQDWDLLLAAGCTWSYERLVRDLRHWDGGEIFYPINLAGTLSASDDAIRKAKLERFPAVRVTPIEQYRFSYGPNR